MPDTEDAKRLPVRQGIREYLGCVAYNNPLPSWCEFEFDFQKLENTIRDRITGVLGDNRKVAEATRITMPHKPGSYRDWLIPTIADRMILQTGVSAVAKPLSDSVTASEKAFGFRYEVTPGSIRFYRDPLGSWLDFEEETKKRLENFKYVLQMDLEEAFASIQRQSFYDYVRTAPHGRIAANLIEKLLSVWDPKGRGIPLVNDSLFFLGSAYLSRLDLLLEKETPEFIRFIDDYRVFGNDEGNLEAILERFNRGLETVGFKLNQRKVHLSSNAVYFRAVEEIKHAEAEIEYFGPAILADIISPDQLVKFFSAVTSQPERYLTLRYGRILLGELRKLRERKAKYPEVYNDFVSHLAKNTTLRENVVNLLGTYRKKRDDTWRVLWLIYMLEDLVPAKKLTEKEKAIVKGLRDDPAVSGLIRLWASKLLRSEPIETTDGFPYIDLPYEEIGRRLYGGKHV